MMKSYVVCFDDGECMLLLSELLSSCVVKDLIVAVR